MVPPKGCLAVARADSDKKPGDTVPIDYIRDGKAATTTVTLAAQP